MVVSLTCVELLPCGGISDVRGVVAAVVVSLTR